MKKFVRVSTWLVNARVHERTIQAFVNTKWRTLRHYPSNKIPTSERVINDCRHVVYVNTDTHITKWFPEGWVQLRFTNLPDEPKAVVHCFGCSAHGDWADVMMFTYGNYWCKACGAQLLDKYTQAL